jgi:hypothetical protein
MFFRKCLGRLIHPGSPVSPPARPSDYAFLHTLCTVWPEGPMAQAFMRDPTRRIAPLAAAEVRKAIEASLYAKFDVGRDQIKILRRIEYSA